MCSDMNEHLPHKLMQVHINMYVKNTVDQYRISSKHINKHWISNMYKYDNLLCFLICLKWEEFHYH